MNGFLSGSRRHWHLLAGLLLLPLWAQADALDGVAFMLEIVAALYGVAVVTAIFVVLAYRKPALLGLQVVQGILLLLCLLLGVVWEQIFSSVTSLSGFFNPFLLIALPLGAWLNGLTLARRAQREGARRLWLAVAIIGLGCLLSLLTSVFRLAPSAYNSVLGMGLHWVFAMATSLASWWLVLRQAETNPLLSQAVRRNWWQQPAVAAGVGVAYHLAAVQCTLWVTNHGGFSYELSWSSLFTSALTTAGIIWVVGVLALRLKQPPALVQPLEAEPGEE